MTALLTGFLSIVVLMLLARAIFKMQMAGSWLARGFVLRLEAQQFRSLMDALLVFAGAVMLWWAFIH